MTRIDVVAYVDWNSQMHNAKVLGVADPARRATKTLQYVQELVARSLNKNGGRRYFIVQLRLYHGWHRGLTPTENMLAVRELAQNATARTIDRVSFGGGILFGYNLIGVEDYRRCRQIRVHLPDTSREALGSADGRREKMVDTAMACDVLSSARSDASDWRLILSEDDDMIPVVFVGEAWAKLQGGRTHIVRHAPPNRFAQTSGLIWQVRD